MSERMLGERFKPGGNRPAPKMSPEDTFFGDAEVSHTFSPADLDTKTQQESSAPQSDISMRATEENTTVAARELAEMSVHEAELVDVLAGLNKLQAEIKDNIAEVTRSLARIKKEKQHKAAAAGIQEPTYPTGIAEA